MSGGSCKYGAIARHIPRNVEELPLIVASSACRQLRADGLHDVAAVLTVLVGEITRRMCIGLVIDEHWGPLKRMGDLLYVLDRVAAGDDGPDDKAEALRKWRDMDA